MSDLEANHQKDFQRKESLRTQAVNSINDSELCQFIGRSGLPLCWRYRQAILHLTYVLTIFSTFCGIFALVSLGVSESATQVAAWSVGRGQLHNSVEVLASVGLSGINWKSQAGTTLTNNYITWENPACVVENRNDPYCDNCNSGGNTVGGLVLLATVTRLPSLMLLKARRLAHADEPLIKVLGVFAEILASICLAGAMFVWNEYCHKQLPYQADVDYTYGSGFILIALGFCTTVGMAVVHLLMLTVDPEIGALPVKGMERGVEMRGDVGKGGRSKGGYQQTQQTETDQRHRHRSEGKERERNPRGNDTEKTARVKDKHRHSREEKRGGERTEGERGTKKTDRSDRRGVKTEDRISRGQREAEAL